MTVQPEEGYGQVDPELLEVIPRDAFEGVDEVKPGMQFQAENPEGEQIQALVDPGGKNFPEIDWGYVYPFWTVVAFSPY